MIISLKSILDMAEAAGTAVGAFNITTLENLQSVLEAAEGLNQSVIIQFANAAHKSYIPMKVVGPLMVHFAEKAKVPVCVHLDHGENLDEVKQAIDMGFSGVMYDGSSLPYEQNVANTRTAVEIAARYGVSVEAEIGSLGREEFASVGGGEAEEVESCYTDPTQAARFVQDTKIDALACSFGTVHGIYVKAPKLDIPRIKKIHDLTGVPVVMHGGSGISDEDFRKCIANGVRKINFYTYAAKYAGEYVKEKVEAAQENIFFHDIAIWGKESMKKTYTDTIKVFSNLN